MGGGGNKNLVKGGGGRGREGGRGLLLGGGIFLGGGMRKFSAGGETPPPAANGEYWGLPLPHSPSRENPERCAPF